MIIILCYSVLISRANKNLSTTKQADGHKGDIIYDVVSVELNDMQMLSKQGFLFTRVIHHHSTYIYIYNFISLHMN